MESTPTNVQNLLEQIHLNKNNPETLQTLLPIVRCPFTPSKYESILMTQLRDINTTKSKFRDTSNKLAALLIGKVVECLSTHSIQVETPLMATAGEAFTKSIELVSIMRSGDALVETFIENFPDANVSKILIQRNEETAIPEYKYMKLSPTISAENEVIILEPMIATGGTLGMVIGLLKEKGVSEKNIIIASVCAAPEGLVHLQNLFPDINVVMIVLDDQLNGNKFILPGIGDFGDRYFGTQTIRNN